MVGRLLVVVCRLSQHLRVGDVDGELLTRGVGVHGWGERIS